MTPAPLHLGGERLLLDPSGALFWPREQTLVVADLHFEKASSAALAGSLLPPWDTHTTLDRLALLLRRYTPRRVVALGDSFHDRDASARLQPHDATRLRAMGEAAAFVWVLGNHDPAPPQGLGGVAVADWRMGALMFRHQASAASTALVEICGHHHPKAQIATRGVLVTRACFVADSRRLMLPAIGAFTGGLDVRHREIAALFPRRWPGVPARSRPAVQLPAGRVSQWRPATGGTRTPAHEPVRHPQSAMRSYMHVMRYPRCE